MTAPLSLAPVCPCWTCRVERAADHALNTNRIVELEDLVIVPDTVVIEAKANGRTLPETWRIMRESDGRVAYPYHRPAGGGSR